MKKIWHLLFIHKRNIPLPLSHSYETYKKSYEYFHRLSQMNRHRNIKKTVLK